eukprot:2260003-Heterocapsa_arctica.AAC.1
MDPTGTAPPLSRQLPEREGDALVEETGAQAAGVPMVAHGHSTPNVTPATSKCAQTAGRRQTGNQSRPDGLHLFPAIRLARPEMPPALER